MKINWSRFDYVGWAIGGIGIAVALWVYHVSQQKPDPSYSIDPNRAVLVSTESASVPDLTIQYKGSLLSGYKPNRFSWLEKKGKSSWESIC
jgi:hypothetical protein